PARPLLDVERLGEPLDRVPATTADVDAAVMIAALVGSGRVPQIVLRPRLLPAQSEAQADVLGELPFVLGERRVMGLVESPRTARIAVAGAAEQVAGEARGHAEQEVGERVPRRGAGDSAGGIERYLARGEAVEARLPDPLRHVDIA